MRSLEEKVARRREKERARILERADRLAEWWHLLDEPYERLISRREETSSTSGFDTEAGVRMCEHRSEWRWGRLCLACENTGWRRLTEKEKAERLGVDPYSAEVSSGITIVRDESPASRRAREAERNDQILAGLRRDARIRAGLEAREDPAMRSYRMVERKPFTVERIRTAVELFKSAHPALYELLPSRRGFLELARFMYRVEPRRRGPIPPAPTG